MQQVTLSKYQSSSIDYKMPDDLVSDDNLKKIHNVTRHISAELTDFFGLECRLGETQARADFLLCCKNENGEREALNKILNSHSLPENWMQHPVWKKVGHFAAIWADAESRIYNLIQNIWLEFDIPDDSSDCIAPSIFIGTDRLDTTNNTLNQTPQWLLDDVISILSGKPVLKSLNTGLDKAFSSLPAGANVFQFGLMLSRQDEISLARLCIRGLTSTTTLTYLKQLGWSGPDHEVAGVVNNIFSLADDVAIDIDMGAEISDKIGFECSFDFTNKDNCRLIEFIDYLTKLGLCLPEKQKGLLGWSHGIHERMEPDTWPDDLKSKSKELGKSTVSMFIRWIYHIKVVYQPGAPMEAKAYLGVRHVWMTKDIIDQVSKT